jgi:hypothetical protein
MTDAMKALHETSEMLKDVLNQINELVAENKALKKATLKAERARPWSGLTTDEITELAKTLTKGNFIAGIQNIESKLRELNT